MSADCAALHGTGELFVLKSWLLLCFRDSVVYFVLIRVELWRRALQPAQAPQQRAGKSQSEGENRGNNDEDFNEADDPVE